MPLSAGGTLRYDAGFLGTDEAASLFATLVRELAWERREIVLFGRRILQPRLIAWAGEVPYRYSGQTLEERPFVPSLHGVLARVCASTGVAFNHVLVNRYRDERDSMGFHSDDEPELGDDPVVATLSLGASRRFVLVPKKRPGAEPSSPPWALELTSGSLLIMDGASQAHYRHGIPKASEPCGERVSLTFRRVFRSKNVGA